MIEEFHNEVLSWLRLHVPIEIYLQKSFLIEIWFWTLSPSSFTNSYGCLIHGWLIIKVWP